MTKIDGLRVSALLLVRNSVDHDARVLRAARVAERELDGTPLVVGVATAVGSAGATMMEGIWVVRFATRSRALAWARRLRRSPGSRPPSRAVAKHQGSNGRAPEVLGQFYPSSRSLTPQARARRILSGLSFALHAVLLARKVRPSIVHANDWNTMWCGLAIKLTCGSRLVYDSHELWADRNGRWEWRPWLVASEALFVRAADEVITSSPGYADALASRYRVPKPVVVRNIPENGTNAGTAVQPERVWPERTPSPLVAALRLSDTHAQVSREWPTATAGRPSPVHVSYIGGLMPGRGLEQMIDALALLEDVRLCAIGPGALRYRESLLARAAVAGVEDRLELRPPVAPSQVRSILTGAAAGLCLIQPVCRSYELCLPNKLFEYAAAGVPILASDVPVIATVVRGEGLGEVVPPADPWAIAAGLERLLQPERWRRVAERVSGFAAAHDWAGEACALTGVYERAIGELAA
jgi:glycosyltransferase involved in cell wall biosynthesis